MNVRRFIGERIFILHDPVKKQLALLQFSAATEPDIPSGSGKIDRPHRLFVMKMSEKIHAMPWNSFRAGASYALQHRPCCLLKRTEQMKLSKRILMASLVVAMGLPGIAGAEIGPFSRFTDGPAPHKTQASEAADMGERLALRRGNDDDDDGKRRGRPGISRNDDDDDGPRRGRPGLKRNDDDDDGRRRGHVRPSRNDDDDDGRRVRATRGNQPLGHGIIFRRD